MKTKKRIAKTRVDKRTSAAQKVVKPKHSDLDLIDQFKKGDLDAFNGLAKFYSRLIDTVANQYTKQGLELKELCLIAEIGLIKAAHRYDEKKPVPFRTYAIWWIRQSILKAIHEQARIDQVPDMLITNLYRISESFHATDIDNIPEPSTIDLDEVVDWKIKDILQQIKSLK